FWRRARDSEPRAPSLQLLRGAACCALVTTSLLAVLLGSSPSLITTATGSDASRSAIWVAAGRIVGVGPSPQEGQRIETHGGAVVPALTDAHAHLVGLGLSLVRVDLRKCGSPGACAALVQKALGSVPPGAWIQGRGWDQNLFPDKQFPTRAALDAVAP